MEADKGGVVRQLACRSEDVGCSGLHVRGCGTERGSRSKLKEMCFPDSQYSYMPSSSRPAQSRHVTEQPCNTYGPCPPNYCQIAITSANIWLDNIQLLRLLDVVFIIIIVSCMSNTWGQKSLLFTSPIPDLGTRVDNSSTSWYPINKDHVMLTNAELDKS